MPRPDRLTPEKETRYPLYRRLGGTQGRSVRAWKISSPPGFPFVFSFTLFVLHPYLFLCLNYPPFYLCVYLQHTTQTSMLPAVFEPAITARDRPQTLALDRSASGVGRFDPRSARS